MPTTKTSTSPARRRVGAAGLFVMTLLVACTGAIPTPTPTVKPSPTTPPTPSPTPSPAPSPTAGAIGHPTEPTAVVLRWEQGGGLMPMEFLTTQAPEFTLYGDRTLIFKPTDTRANDPFGGQAMLPYQVGHLDEEGVQALLAFALGQGRLLAAKPNYENNMVADAGTTILTVNAAGLHKVVSIYALGMEDPSLPQDVADRKGFQALTEQLATFEARGKNGELGEVKDYDPALYRVFLLSAEGAVPAVAPLDWPWPDLTPADFKAPADDTRAQANLDKAHVEKVETVPTGGRSGLYVKDAHDTLYSVGIRPLFPDEVASAGATSSGS